MQRRTYWRTNTRTSAIALLVASCFAGAVPAFAQSAADAGQEDQGDTGPDADVAEITVVGSRVNRPGFDAPTPTTVIDAGTLDVKSSRTLVETLSLLPAFKGTTTPGSGGAAAAGSGGGGFLNLRGLGTTRTLLLMDRQRLLPVNANGEVDVSLLPTSLLSGVDVVTGGASASWGSDAVAGVVNFRLDSRYRGLTLDADMGISRYGDGAAYKLGGKFGFDIGDNVQVVGALEHEKNDGVTAGDASERSFGRSDFGNLTNPNAPPALAILPFTYLRETFGGLIVGGPLDNMQFGPDGQLAPYAPCGPQTGNNYQCPSLQSDAPWQGYYTSLYSPLKRSTGFVRASWDVSPDVTVYADLLAGKSRTLSFTIPATSLVATIGNLTVNRDNAYLPSGLATQMDANGLASVSVRRFFRDQGPLVLEREAGIVRGSFGLKADLGSGWKLDAYAAYGKSKLDAGYNNVTILQNLKNAVDSVRVGGVATCRINADASAANDDAACRPINIFGDGAVLTTPEGLDYYTADGFSKTRSHQFSSGATITSEPFSTWAGPVSFVGGAEYRSFTTRIRVDALSEAKRFFAINAQPLFGKVNVKEAFAEVVVPLAKDVRFLQNLDVSAAGRITDYSTSGTVKTWKLGVNYAPLDGLRFRGTISRDIRAPNISELFSLLTQTTGGLNVIDRNDNSTATIRSLVGGNRSLKPEIAITKSVGAVVEPALLPGFQLSADYYNIKVSGAITAPSAQTIIDVCAAGDADFCNLVYRNDVAGASTGTITRVDALFVNLAEFRTEGVDFEASYRFDLAGGTARLGALANRTINFVQETPSAIIDSTDSQANPKWAGDVNLTYENGGTHFFLGATYRGGGRINPNFTELQLANNRTGSVIYVSTALGQKIAVGDKDLTLRFSINNLFDKKPPYGFPQIVTGDTYDRVGRYYKISLKFEM